MAYPVSEYGSFQITALSFTPSVMACEESAVIKVKLKNTSGKKITKCVVYAMWACPKTGGGADLCGDVFLYGGPDYSVLSSINWANGTEHEFAATIYQFCSKQKEVLDTSSYVFDPTRTSVSLTIDTDVALATGRTFDSFDDISGSSGEYLTVLLERDNPRVSLEILRTPNDESITVKTTARLLADKDLSVLNAHGYTVRLYASNAHSPALTTDTAVTFTPTLTTLYSGITESTSAISGTFSNGNDWSFLLVVTNGYETAKAYTSVPRAFANVHLSGCTTGGVAFGKFSGATEGSPIFECEYPAVFNGGVKVTEQVLTVASSFKAYTAAENSGYSGVILRSNGIMAELFGTVSPNSSISGSTTPYLICTLPAELSPRFQINQVCQGTNQNVWMLRIDPDGGVSFSRYRASSSWASASNTVWLPFHCVWLL